MDYFKLLRVSKNDTGLEYDLLLNYKEFEEEPLIRIEKDNKIICIHLNEPNILVENYIKKYYNIIMDHYNGIISDKETLNLLNK